MFESPKRNHASIVLERAGAAIAMLLVFGARMLEDNGWEIFHLSFYRALWQNAMNGGAKTGLIALLASAVMLWYLFISVRYWRLTTFCIDGDDFVFARRTMFRAESRLPIRNIAVVNVERNIFERAIGTAKVKIDLNSSRTAGATDFQFVLRHEEALLLKETLMQKKQTLTGEPAPRADEESAPDASREAVAFFTVPQALRHKLLSMPILNWAGMLVVLFILPQMRVSGDYNMSRLWFLLVFAVAGWIWSIVNGTLNLGNYKVERDERMIYITCGVINQRQYVFEREKINAVMVNQPLLSRFFGLSSIDLAVVGFGNEKNETTHLCLLAERDQVEAILRQCVPDFTCAGEEKRCHVFNLVLPILRAFAIGCGVWALEAVYAGAWTLAILVFLIAFAGAVSEYRIRAFAFDGETLRYSGGTFNKRTCVFKYGDVQHMRFKTNVLFRRLRLSALQFSILGAAAVRMHKTGLYRDAAFAGVTDHMVSHTDSILKNKAKKRE